MISVEAAEIILFRFQRFAKTLVEALYALKASRMDQQDMAAGREEAGFNIVHDAIK